MANYLDNDEVISLFRDCDVISVPYGEKHVLKQGTEVQLMQAMGGLIQYILLKECLELVESTLIL